VCEHTASLGRSGVPTSEVGYTIATTRGETTKVHKNMWWHWERKKRLGWSVFLSTSYFKNCYLVNGLFHRLLCLRCLCPSLYKHSVPIESTYIHRYVYYICPYTLRHTVTKRPFLKSFRYIYNALFYVKMNISPMLQPCDFNVLDKGLIMA